MKSFILLIFFIITISSISSCSSLKEWTKETFEPKSDFKEVHTKHQPLEKQRLIPRPGYEGYLTNQICTKWYGNDCETTSTRKYSLKDAKFRNTVIEFNFACRIGGKRYRICKDQAGFCRKEKIMKCIKWGKKFFSRKKVCRKWHEEIKKKFLPIENYKFLLDGGTYCKQGL